MSSSDIFIDLEALDKALLDDDFRHRIAMLSLKELAETLADQRMHSYWHIADGLEEHRKLAPFGDNMKVRFGRLRLQFNLLNTLLEHWKSDQWRKQESSKS